MSKRFLIIVVFISLFLNACSTSRYRMEHDAPPPPGEFNPNTVKEHAPAWEPLSYRGNTSPYEVRGVKYHILDRTQGYVEEGIASWYGMKFHGEETSNGEIYDMYALTAAHKTLPLPSYLKVTNLHNGKSIIVRVNDRGPFHSSRIIDLSYAAAHKLGFAQRGTAKVRLEAVPMAEPKSAQTTRQEQLKPFVQVAAYSSEESAQQVRQSLQAMLPGNEVFVTPASKKSGSMYRVRVGPFADKNLAEQARAMIAKAQIGNPMVIIRAIAGRDL